MFTKNVMNFIINLSETLYLLCAALRYSYYAEFRKGSAKAR